MVFIPFYTPSGRNCGKIGVIVGECGCITTNPIRERPKNEPFHKILACSLLNNLKIKGIMSTFDVLSSMKLDIADEISGIKDILSNYNMGLITQRECYKQIQGVTLRCDGIVVKATDKLDIDGDKSQFMDNLIQSGILDRL